MTGSQVEQRTAGPGRDGTDRLHPNVDDERKFEYAQLSDDLEESVSTIDLLQR